jgi:hypothetical protein
VTGVVKGLQLLPLLPWMFMMGASLMTVAALKILGLASTGAFLTLMGGGYFATTKSKPDESTVNIQAGKFLKICWQGAGALGLLVAGILLIVLAFRTSQIL